MSTKHIQDYDSFINEGFAAPAASVLNTPGMGNVTANNNTTEVTVQDSADQDLAGKHLRMHEEGTPSGLERFRPNGDYSNRQWLVHNYEMYMNVGQSNTKFQIGEAVRCINPMKESYGKVGKIVAFEDNTIRWELAESEVGVGQTAKQYRCHASNLMKLNIVPTA
jgi:hypothetical protein